MNIIVMRDEQERERNDEFEPDDFAFGVADREGLRDFGVFGAKGERTPLGVFGFARSI